MKIAATYLISIISTINCFAQSNIVEWAKNTVSPLYDYSSDICTDINGNVIVSGNFKGQYISFGTNVVSNIGTQTAFIAKYDSFGNNPWAKGALGLNDVYSNALCTDANGNVYMVGTFTGPSVKFDTITLTRLVSPNNNSAAFIVKYDANGNALWAKSKTYYQGTTITDIALDSLGNIIVVGNCCYEGIFMIKYDENGNELWESHDFNAERNSKLSLTLDGNMNIYVYGGYGNTWTIDSATTLPDPLFSDLFLFKYDPVGNFLWVKTINGSDLEPASITNDNYGNVYLTGHYRGFTISFGGLVLTSSAYNSGFLAKYDSLGNTVWANTINCTHIPNGNKYNYANKAVLDLQDHIYLIGEYYSSSLIFGNDTLTNTTQPSLSYRSDIYIAKYDLQGNVLGANSFGGTHGETGKAIAIDTNNNLYILGEYRSTTFNLGTINLYNTDTLSTEFYIAKLNGSIVNTKDYSNNLLISIAPNPFNQSTTLSFSQEQKNSSIKIIDILGHQIKSFPFSGKQLIIDKGNMEPGIYFVQVSDENKIASNIKIVVQ
jgi:hypothetical protein